MTKSQLFSKCQIFTWTGLLSKFYSDNIRIKFVFSFLWSGWNSSFFRVPKSTSERLLWSKSGSCLSDDSYSNWEVQLKERIFMNTNAYNKQIYTSRNIDQSWQVMLYIIQTLCLGTTHKGRLLKGVGRWVHQKEIY